MTPERWKAGTNADVYDMAEFVRLQERRSEEKANRRKSRLFAVACARSIWDKIPDELWRQAFDVAERYADGTTQEKEREQVLRAVNKIVHHRAADGISRYVRNNRTLTHAYEFAWRALQAYRSWHNAVHGSFLIDVIACAGHLSGDPNLKVIPFADLMRDIFNPLRLEIKREWKTDTIIALARQMYATGDFSAMPVMADALQEAGCDNDDILSHCRNTSIPHVRGSWIVDDVLGTQHQSIGSKRGGGGRG